jgi:hypothetical protein
MPSIFSILRGEYSKSGEFTMHSASLRSCRSPKMRGRIEEGICHRCVLEIEEADIDESVMELVGEDHPGVPGRRGGHRSGSGCS